MNNGNGILIHPTIGVVEYEEPPDEWVNFDQDIIIPPTWASTKTLTSSANVLWLGNIRDVTVEERWKQDLSMPVDQFRAMIAIWTTPVDPTVGYVQWFPQYANPNGYNVIPMKLSAGGGEGFVFNDVINALDRFGNEDGWITNPVIFTMKIISKSVGYLVFSPNKLTNGFIGAVYSATVKVIGGVPPYAFSGVFPTGFTIDTVTGVITGVAQLVGITVTLVVTATDSLSASGSIAYTVTFS